MENQLGLGLDQSPYSAFTMALRSPITRQKYLQRLGYFLSFVGINEENIEDGCDILGHKIKTDSSWLTNSVIRYLQIHRQRAENREITGATLRNYLKPIKLFCEQLEISLPWQRITRGLPKGRRYANDRVPTIEEIHKIVAYPDRRIKPIVYTMASSGIRLGAWNYLKWGHVIEVKKDGKIVAAKLRVYAEEDEEYFTFITLEAWNELSSWIEYRQESGEIITDESWLMRNLWDVTTPKGKGVVTVSKQLRPDGIKRLMERALWAQGIRKNLSKNRRRHEFQVNHSYRKWFKTRCELAGMRSIVVEELLSHSTGISDSYFRPNEIELLNEYLKAADFLTIEKENRLSKRIDDLTEDNKNNQYIIEGKLKEKDDEIKNIKSQLESIQEQFNLFLHKLASTNDQEQINKAAKILYDSGILVQPRRE